MAGRYAVQRNSAKGSTCSRYDADVCKARFPANGCVFFVLDEGRRPFVQGRADSAIGSEIDVVGMEMGKDIAVDAGEDTGLSGCVTTATTL